MSGVDLRYQPVFAESRSYMLDEAAGRPAAKLPLYLEQRGGAGAARAMEQGEAMLRSCIAQLAQAADSAQQPYGLHHVSNSRVRDLNARPRQMDSDRSSVGSAMV